MRTRSLARPEPAEKSPDRLAHSAFLDDPVTLRHFLAHIAEGVYITTPNDVLRDANPAFLEIFGAQSLKDLEGQPFRELLIDSGVREQQRLALAESGRIVDFELEIRRLDGTVRSVNDTVYEVRDAGGAIVAYHGILEDVTEHRLADEVIRHERQYLAALIESSPLPIVSLDTENRIVNCNPAFESLFLFDRSEAIGKRLDDMIVPAHERVQGQALSDRVQAGERVRLETQRQRKDGALIPVELFGVPVLVDGKHVGIYGIYKDLRDSRQKEEKLQKQMQRMAALHSIDMAITDSLDLRLTLSVLLDQVMTQLHADAVGVLLLDPHTQLLECAAARGFRNVSIQQSKLRLGESRAGRAVLERRVISVPALSDTPADLVLRQPVLSGEDFVSYYAAPVISKGQVKAVLEVYYRSPFKPNQEWLDFLNSLATRAAIAIDNARSFDDLQRTNAELSFAYDAALEGWSRALELRDIETEGHTVRVTEMTMRLARTMGIGKEELVHVRRGSLLHDIGKMAVPDNILRKRGALTEAEWEIMRRHPVYAYSMLSPIPYLRPALDIPYCHHERWDGTGYPRGLMGDQTTLAARIFAVADVWDALRSDRPYRAAWPSEKAMRYIREQAGQQFDPGVVEAFTDILAAENGDKPRF